MGARAAPRGHGAHRDGPGTRRGGPPPPSPEKPPVAGRGLRPDADAAGRRAPGDRRGRRLPRLGRFLLHDRVHRLRGRRAARPQRPHAPEGSHRAPFSGHLRSLRSRGPSDKALTLMAVRAANIGPKGRRRRALMGVATLAVGVVALVVSLMSGVDRAWRVALVEPFWAGALGLSPAAAPPWVTLPRRGRRHLGAGRGPLPGPWRDRRPPAAHAQDSRA